MDDGAYLYINGAAIISFDGSNGWGTATGSVMLTAGVRTLINITYFQGGGNSGFELDWSSATTARTNVPSSALYYCNVVYPSRLHCTSWACLRPLFGAAAWPGTARARIPR